MVEATIAMSLLLVLTLGFVDFGNAFYQWNAAAKAVQVGARMASVSPPVADEVTSAGPSSTPGEPVPADSYSFVCRGTGPSAGNCDDGATDGTFNPTSFNRIYAGDDGVCGAVAGSRPGMCDFFPRLRPQDVQVSYVATGLGYQTRPGGAVPTVTVEIRPGLAFEFFFLAGLLGFDDINIPPMRSTVTGEDLGNGG
jgi:Flp pilus assembly protein TadG